MTPTDPSAGPPSESPCSSGMSNAQDVELPNLTWHRQVHASSYVLFSKLDSTSSSTSTSQPAVITRCIEVREDFSWVVYIHDHKLNRINENTLLRLLNLVDTLHVCPGNPDIHFVEMATDRKGEFRSKTDDLMACADSYAPVFLNGESYPQTVRATTCELLVGSGKCEQCKKYCATLRAMYSRWSIRRGKEASKYTNDQHLNTPQRKRKLTSLRTGAYEAEREVNRLRGII